MGKADIELVLGIDLGTSYFKCLVADRAGRLAGLGRRAVPVAGGGAGRVEVPVAEFWRVLREAVAEALAAAGAPPTAVRAVSYSSQANSFLLLDAAGRPLTPLVLWSDVRAAGQLSPRLTEFWARPDFSAISGVNLRPGAGFCLAKLGWFQEHQPEIWRLTSRVMTISDYLTFSLTGAALGDQSTAALLGAWDVAGRRWWQPALEAAGLSEEMLARPMPPGSVAGTVNAAGAELLGIAPDAVFAVGALDHQVAGFGAGAGFLADCSVSLGTVLALLRFSDEFRATAGGCAGAAAPEQGFWQLAFSGNGATGIEWFQKLRTPQLSLAELDLLAAAAAPGCRGLRCLPQPAAQKGIEEAFTGIRPEHQPGEFVRAIMESCAGTLHELLGRLFAGTPPPCSLAVTGGGARSRPWLDIIAGTTGCRVVTTPGNPEPACMGAAMTAARAAGWFPTLEAAARAWLHPLG